MSIFTKHLQVQYFQFEYYCAFANAIKKTFVRPFQRVSHAYPTNSSVAKSFLKSP